LAVYQDTLYIDPAYADVLTRAELDTVQRVIECEGDRLAAWSRTTDSIQVFLDSGACVFVKRYHYHRWKNRLKGMLRGTLFGLSRVRAEFRALEAMRSLGIQAVRPVAYGERRSLHFVHSCFLITEAVPGSISLATYAQQFARENLDPRSFRMRKRILTGLAQQVRHMHERGFVHGDLFWRNILIRIFDEETCEFYFLDACLGHKIWRKGRDRRDIVNDLAGLTAIAPAFCTRTDMMRFAKVYLGRKRLEKSDADWMNRVANRSMAYRKHEALRLRLNEVFNLHVRDIETVEQASAQ
jgi:tRNA A-37 threonylcarbamoyl transferase component Bud32